MVRRPLTRTGLSSLDIAGVDGNAPSGNNVWGRHLAGTVYAGSAPLRGASLSQQRMSAT